MADKDNGNNNVVQFPKNGNEALSTPYDAGYLRWVRLSANDTQLLGMRDEMRTHRANLPIYEGTIQQYEQNHAELQNQFMILTQLLCWMVLKDPENAQIGADEVLSRVHISGEDLTNVKGLTLNINVNESQTGWDLSVLKGEE